MNVRQLSIFVENKAGRLSEVTHILGQNNINILGFSVADMADYGIFRVIVSDTDTAKKLLRDASFTVTESQLVCADIPNRPGGLAGVLKIFSDAGINVEYMYAIVDTLIVFCVDQPEQAVSLLADHGLKVVDWEEFSKLENK